MATAAQMRTACEQYCKRLTDGDAEGVAALFAPDAWIEDPVGSERKVGREVLLAFYRGAIDAASPQLEPTGPVRIAVSGAAAMPFRSQSNFGGSPSEIDIIDVFTFDADGLITSMTAYFGPENIRER